MKPHCVRQICRSRNLYSPSIVLWQHFVQPCQLRQQRLFSSETETTPSSAPNAEILPSPPAPTPDDAPEIEHNEQQAKRGPTRKVLDKKGMHEFTSPRQASMHKNANARAEQSTVAAHDILLKTKTAYDKSEDYEGVVVEAILASRAPAEKLLPWCVPRTSGDERRSEDRLALEIAKFHDYAKPSRTEALARRQVIEQARKDVHEVLPEYVLEIFGSERTGIALATSDIDLRLVRREDLVDGSGKIVPPRWERKALEKALKTLFTRKFFRNPKYLLPVLRHARYPLLSLQHGASGLDIQIVLANDTSVSREYMRQYMQEYPYLRQVYSIVKTLFEVRGLSDVFRGGFGSYSIFMMIVASLQQMPHKRKDAMGALQNFLRFWAQFDTTEKGISIDPPELFDKREKLVMPPKVQEMVMADSRKALPPYMLCLCDPADATNDLGRKGISIKHVQATLRHLDRKLSMDLRADTRHSFLRPLVGDIFALNRARRKRLVEEGRTVLDTMHSSLAQTARLIREEEITAREMHNKVAETEEVKSEEGLDTPGDAVASDSTLPCADEFGNEEVQKEGSGKDDGSEPAITYQVNVEKEEMEGSEKDDGSELSTTDHRSRE